jgi:hypothetical protein
MILISGEETSTNYDNFELSENTYSLNTKSTLQIHSGVIPLEDSWIFYH